MTDRIVAEQLVADRYELGEQIGAGGVGRIFKAHDRLLNRAVALKLIPVDSEGEQALAEARAAARLSGRHIASVLDAGHQSGCSYIVMELLPGPSLEEELADRGRLSSGEVRDLAVQTLSALAEAHADGTIHCDVKPSNILRAADGTWKLVDFGIACAGADAPEDEFWGTPGYVPPERLAGTPAAPVGDLYSLSVVLYEALTGVQPFARDSVEATIAAVRAGRHAATASVRPDADPLLASAIDRGMAPTPSERFAAAHDMAAAIERASKQQETPPLATAPIPVLAPTEQLTPAKVGAPQRTRTLPDAAGASHHRRSRLIALGIGLAAVAVLVTLTLAMTNQGMRAHARARTTGFDQAFTASTPAVRVSTPPASSTQVSSPAPSPASHDGPAITGPGNGNGNGHAYGHSKGNH